jgi:putative hydrolase of the HAD superfamily
MLPDPATRKAEAMKSPILLFDLGGVLIENALFDALQGLLPERLDPAVLRARWLGCDAVRRFELGQITPEAFAVAFLEEWALDLAPQDFIREFTGWPKGFYPGAEALLARLRGRYPVHCLSNSNVLHWDRFDGFQGYFDTAHSSHLLGMIKPDREIFAWVIEALSAEPEQIHFYDDSGPNVSAAESFGIQARHVEGFAALEAMLRSQRLI